MSVKAVLLITSKYCAVKLDLNESTVHLLFVMFWQRLLIAKEFGDKSAERRAHCNLGNAHIFLNQFEVAAGHYKWVNLRLKASLTS